MNAWQALFSFLHSNSPLFTPLSCFAMKIEKKKLCVLLDSNNGLSTPHNNSLKFTNGIQGSFREDNPFYPRKFKRGYLFYPRKFKRG